MADERKGDDEIEMDDDTPLTFADFTAQMRLATDARNQARLALNAGDLANAGYWLDRARDESVLAASMITQLPEANQRAAENRLQVFERSFGELVEEFRAARDKLAGDAEREAAEREAARAAAARAAVGELGNLATAITSHASTADLSAALKGRLQGEKPTGKTRKDHVNDLAAAVLEANAGLSKVYGTVRGELKRDLLQEVLARKGAHISDETIHQARALVTGGDAEESDASRIPIPGFEHAFSMRNGVLYFMPTLNNSKKTVLGRVAIGFDSSKEPSGNFKKLMKLLQKAHKKAQDKGVPGVTRLAIQQAAAGAGNGAASYDLAVRALMVKLNPTYKASLKAASGVRSAINAQIRGNKKEVRKLEAQRHVQTKGMARVSMAEYEKARKLAAKAKKAAVLATV